MLFQQLVQFGHFHTGALGHALLAAGLQKVGIGAFLPGHRLDQRDLAFQHPVVKPGLFRRLGHAAHAGQHPHDRLHAAHLQHLLKLGAQVVHVEQTLGEAPRHALGLFDLKRLTGFLDQGDDIAHAQNPARDPFGLERLKRVHLFAHTDKADRLAGHGAHRQGGTTAPVAVHPGQHDAGDADLAVEFRSHVDRVLASQTIDHQQHFARLHDVAHRLHFVHQHFVDVQPARRVKENNVIAAHCGLRPGPPGNLNRRLALDDGQTVHPDLPGQDRQLLHRRRAVGVKAGQQHPLAVTLFQPLGQLGRCGGLARTLQTHHQNGRGRVVDLQRLGLVIARQHPHQFVMHDLDDLLARRDRFGDGLPGRLDLDGFDKIPRHV